MRKGVALGIAWPEHGGATAPVAVTQVPVAQLDRAAQKRKGVMPGGCGCTGTGPVRVTVRVGEPQPPAGKRVSKPGNVDAGSNPVRDTDDSGVADDTEGSGFQEGCVPDGSRAVYQGGSTSPVLL